MNSMTGFAAIEKEQNGLRLSIRVRAVNGRFFEFKPHMPSDYFSLESALKKQINESLKRGTVDLFISRKFTGKARGQDIVANEALAKKWMESYKDLQKATSLEGSLSMDHILRVPGVLSVEESHDLPAKEKAFVKEILAEVLEKCQVERAREGKAMAKDLMGLLRHLEANVKKISEHRNEVNESLKERYLKKLDKLGLKEELEPSRLAQEIIVQVDKLDITEELFRLKEHFRAIKELIKIDDQVLGKKLDFYTQELLREMNTIGSKCQHSGITSFVVESKGTIERFREIVQNVE